MGKRMRLDETRKIVDAIHDGSNNIILIIF